MMAAVAASAAVGWRVRVFWEGDDEWFEGVVAKYAPESGYFVEYDDGEHQWEIEDPTRIQFLYQCGATAEKTTQLISNAEAETAEEHRDGAQQPQGYKWSAQPPPSTTGYDDDDAYEEDEYEADHDEEEEEDDDGKSTTVVGSPKPEEEADDETRDCKPSPHAAAPTRSIRDATKFIKSGVFFRDPEMLHETMQALLNEKHELSRQYEQLTAALTQKEQLSQSLKRELYGLKAQITVASLRCPSSVSGSPTGIPKTARAWGDRVATQKTANRATRQQLSERHTQLTQKQTTIHQMEKQKQQLEATLARVPRKELRSLVEIQMVIAQVTAEKRMLETQLAKSLPTERAKNNKVLASQDQRDTKTELETELRQFEKTLTRVCDQVDEWKLRQEKERAKITPVRARIKRLQTDLHAYETSQVLLRSVFLRLDRSGDGSVTLDAALEACTLLASHDDKRASKQELGARLPETTPTSLDFSAFKICFEMLFPRS